MKNDDESRNGFILVCKYDFAKTPDISLRGRLKRICRVLFDVASQITQYPAVIQTILLSVMPY